MNLLKARLEEVEQRIANAAVRSGRPADAVRLVVVTKGHPSETIRQVVEAGARHLGENYADQALPKIEALGPLDAEWHMIGHIQSRKAAIVAGNFDMVHSLDSVKLARRLDEARTGKTPLPVLLQINVSGEAQKFGIPAWNQGMLEEAANLIRQMTVFENLDLCGLMTIPPFLPEEEVRPYFRAVIQAREFFEMQIPGLSLPEMSMGMSGDYEAAVEEGATIVRVGTAILGPRTQ